MVIFNIPAHMSPTTKKIKIFTDIKLIHKFHPILAKELRCVTLKIMKYEASSKTSMKALPHSTCRTCCSKPHCLTMISLKNTDQLQYKNIASAN